MCIVWTGTESTTKVVDIMCISICACPSVDSRPFSLIVIDHLCVIDSIGIPYGHTFSEVWAKTSLMYESYPVGDVTDSEDREDRRKMY